MKGAVGDATSAPAMPAMTSVLWTVFNIVPFAVRAPKQAHGCGPVPVQAPLVLRDVPFRSGTTAGA